MSVNGSIPQNKMLPKMQKGVYFTQKCFQQRYFVYSAMGNTLNDVNGGIFH